MFFPIQGDPYRNNVVLHLPMTGENNSTTFTDVSQSPKTMTPTNAIISTAQSKWGSSGYFPNKTAYLSTPNVSSLQLHSGDYTVELWAYFLTVPSASALMANRFYGSGDVFPFSLAFGTPGSLGGISGSVLYFGYYNGNWYGVFTDFTPSINTWYHIAATRSGNAIKVFVDGVPRASMTISSQPGAPTQEWVIGRRWDNNGDIGIDGYLQDLRITTGIARYTDAFAIPTSLLPVRSPYWPITSITEDSSLTIARLGL